MLRKIISLPISLKILLLMFLFVTVYSLFHLILGIIHLNWHNIIGGILFPMVSVPMVIITLNYKEDA